MRAGSSTGLATAGVVLGVIGLVVSIVIWIAAAAVFASN